ncbi:MAG: sensor histidine kinase [Leptodesmis sp.]|uniref:sensor histidine kinase n=1 Tax=Leptodesmis sp. TaxID=3100501 RepID=UPI003D0C8BC2
MSRTNEHYTQMITGASLTQGSANSKWVMLRNEWNRSIRLMDEILNLPDGSVTTGGCPSASLGLQAIGDLYFWLVCLVEPFWSLATKRQQILKLALSPNLPRITTNSSALTQVLVELLTNACKYTPVGERITFSATLQSYQLSLCVTNTGVEIPANQLPFIFEPYYRIPRNIRWHTDGTGLGLAFVKQLVDHIGATILVDSSVGCTKFTLLLPVS